MICKAWSQGTSLSRRVKLPLTESETTKFRWVKSANTLRAERTSMFWKFIVMGAPSKVDLKETVGIAKLKEVVKEVKEVKEADGGAAVDK